MATLLDNFRAVFGAALAPFYLDGVLHRTTLTDDGVDGFTPGTVDWPVKLLLQSLSDQDRAAAGLPRTAVRLGVLGAGLPGPIAIDDSLTLNGTTYRVIGVDADGLGASITVSGVPA